MNPPWSTSSAWWHALTLTERIAVMADDGVADTRLDADADAAESHLQRWRSQPPFDDDDVFAQRLALDAIDEQTLRTILATPAETLQNMTPQLPSWIVELTAAYAQAAYPGPQAEGEEFGFLELVQPLVDRACDQLFDCVEYLINRWPRLPFDPDLIEEVLLMNLPDPLLMRLGRALTLELNVARLLGELEGDTPEARFQAFITRLQQPETSIALLAEYPVLARQLLTCIDQWCEVSMEVLQRLCADWEEICRCFSPHQYPGPLVELVGGAGDTHRGGRSVMIARFESGLQVVYKPKSLAVDQHFQDLLTWLNQHGCSPRLRTLAMLDREEYGWVEYVEHRGCDTHAEIERFYQRLGAHLALLYAINASDYHLENLIADGEEPVLIDLETLFTPNFERYDPAEAESEASKAMLQSVLVVGMLPQHLWSDDEYGGIDISGLGGEEGQLSPDRFPQPTEIGTDAMRFVRERTELPAEANRPLLNDVATSAVDYVDEIVAGFCAMYSLLGAHRDALLANDGPLSRFEQDEIRVLMRPTRTYDQLFFESFHPDVLRDGLERAQLMDRLWVVVPDRAYMPKVIAAEQADLLQGDIPVFTTRPTSLNLWSAAGEVIEGVLIESGMTLARRHLTQLSEEDMRRQEWFIRCTMATISPSGRGFDRPAPPAYRLPQVEDGLSRARLMAGARAVADRLAATAIHGEDDVTWLGFTPLPEELWDVAPLEMDLYGGVPGVALFLAYAGDLLGDERYTSLARRGLNPLLRYVEQFAAVLPEIGGFGGWGGALHAITHLAALWRDSTLLVQADEAVEAIARFVEEDDTFGIVYGAAGAIGALLAYHRFTPSDKALEAAVACGDHLIASAQPQEQGLGWVAAGFGAQALTGFGHGAAGIAWSLLELAAVSGDERYRRTALAAIDYERSHYSLQSANWLDLRQDQSVTDDPGDESPRVMTAWCHGAAGIGMARLQALRHTDDPQLHDEIDAALNATLSHGFGRNHSLCHGDLGSLELLVQAGQVLDDPHWRAEGDRLAAMILENMDRDGWRCGGPEAVETPSLMIGLAGIGYQLLRLAAPERVPSLLMLSAPAPPGPPPT